MKTIKILVSVIILTISFFSISHAQESKSAPKHSTAILAPTHRIVFQMVTGDTLAHKQLVKQISNIITVSPKTEIEVVCHGPGLQMLLSNKSVVADKISQLASARVSFNACEFSMKEKNITAEELIPSAGRVPYGILELVTKQEEGWSYIKAGF